MNERMKSQDTIVLDVKNHIVWRVDVITTQELPVKNFKYVLLSGFVTHFRNGRKRMAQLMTNSPRSWTFSNSKNVQNVIFGLKKLKVVII